MRNKLYTVYISKKVPKFNNILDVSTLDTLEEALDFGKNVIKMDCYNELFKYTLNPPDDITSEQLDSFIKINDEEYDIYYRIVVDIISTDRKKFNTSKELMEYFNSNIKDISNDNLYDFLLSMVNSEIRIYDYNGNLITRRINTQCPLLESIYSDDIEFTEESCSKGIYTFEYKY